MKTLRGYSGRLFTLFLAVQIACVQSLAAAADGSALSPNQSPIEFFSSPIINPEGFTSVPAENYSHHPDSLTAEDKKSLHEFIRVPTQYTLEIMWLLQKHYQSVTEQIEELGFEEFVKKTKKRQSSDPVGVEEERIGKAEPLLYTYKDRAIMFTKVRHNGLKRIFFFIDVDQVKLDLIEQPPSKDLDPEAYKEELRERRAISKYIRTLTARMLLQDWNPNFQYVPLAEGVNIPSIPENLQEKVSEIMNAEGEVLESRSWFQKLKQRAADLTLQIEQDAALKGGWDVMLIAYSGKAKQVVSSKVIEKPSIFSGNKAFSAKLKSSLSNTYLLWKSYWLDIWETPEYDKELWRNSRGFGKLKVVFTGDYFNGLFWGVTLSTLVGGATWALQDMLPPGLDPMGVAWNSFGFSLFFGVFGKTWQRVTYKGSELVRFVKNSLPGLVQTYSLFAMSDASVIPFREGQIDPQALKMNADAMTNIAVKSSSKTGAQEKVRFRAQMGEAQGTLKIPYPKFRLPTKELPFMQFEVIERELKLSDHITYDLSDPKVIANLPELQDLEKQLRGWKFKDIKIKMPWISIERFDTKVSRKNFEGQSVQLKTTVPGMASKFGWMVPDPIFGIPIPLGHILYTLVGVDGRREALAYKKHYLEDVLKKQLGPDHPETKRVEEYVIEAQRRWDGLRILGIPGSQYVGYFFKELPMLVFTTLKTIATWTTHQGMYHSYRFYRAASLALREIETQNRSTAEANELIRRIMTVQSEDGRAHPQQINNELERLRTSEVQEAAPMTCRALF